MLTDIACLPHVGTHVFEKCLDDFWLIVIVVVVVVVVMMMVISKTGCICVKCSRCFGCSFVRSFGCFTLGTFPNLFLSLFKAEIFLPQEALATQVPLVLVLALDMDFLLVTLGGSNVCPEGATKPGSFKLVTPCLANY